MNIIKPNYNDSIMSVSNSFLKYYDVETNYSSQKDLDKILQKRKPKHIIYVLLDGLGLNVVKKHLSKDDALRKYCLKGISSVFPPTTVAATNAVLSATPPIVNGHIGWVQYFDKEDVNLAVFLNRDFYDENKTYDYNFQAKYLSFESIVTKIGKNENIKSTALFPSFMPGGSESFKEEIEKVLMITNNSDQSFSYLYWTQPDLSEHVHGIYSEEVKSVVNDLNLDFESLIENVPQDTLVVCIADHGLTDVIEIPLYEYERLNSMLVRKPSIEPRAINFFVKDNSIEEFKNEFNKHFEDKYLLLTKKEFLDQEFLGIGKQHTKLDSFLGDYIAIAIDKYMFSLSQGKRYKAHHAGLLEDEMIVPLIMYTK